MTTEQPFDVLKEWASSIAKEYAPHGQVQVKEHPFPNGGVTIDLEFERALAQVNFWPNGMLEFQVFAVESGEQVAIEDHEIHGNDELAAVLRKVEQLVAATQDAS